MNNIVRMFSRKSIIIIGIIVLILLIGCVGVIFVATRNARQNAFEIGGRRPPASAEYHQLADELGEAYTVSYPTHWEASQTDVAGGGTNTTITLASQDEDAPVATINIQGVSADDTTVGKVEGSFEAFGYEWETGSIQGIPATRFSGSMRELHEIVYVFEKDNVVYTMRLSYVASAPDPKIEEQFEEVANTFTFN
jgi:hypothetical protein